MNSIGKKIAGSVVGFLVVVGIKIGALAVSHPRGFANAVDSVASNKARAENTLTRVEGDDAEVNAAIAMAQSKLPNFLAIADKPPAGFTQFVVKVGFPVLDHPGSTEHIWVSNFSHNNRQFSGTLTDEPNDNIGNMHAGQLVQFDQSQISDWVFKNQGKVYGGFTICALLKHQTPSERAAVLAAMPVQCGS